MSHARLVSRLRLPWAKLARRLAASPAATAITPPLLLPLAAILIVASVVVYATIWKSSEHVRHSEQVLTRRAVESLLRQAMDRTAAALDAQVARLSSIDAYMVAYYENQLEDLFAREDLERHNIGAAFVLIPDGSVLYALQDKSLTAEFARMVRPLLEAARTADVSDRSLHGRLLATPEGALTMITLQPVKTRTGNQPGAVALAQRVDGAMLAEIRTALGLGTLSFRAPGAAPAAPASAGASLDLAVLDNAAEGQLVWSRGDVAMQSFGRSLALPLTLCAMIVMAFVGLYLLQVRRVARRYDEAMNQAGEGRRERTAIVAQMHHELRTPLTQILGYVDVLRAQIFGPLTPKQAECVDHVGQAGRTLQSVLENLIEYRNIASLDRPINDTRIDILAECQSMIRLMKPAAEPAHITLMLQRQGAARFVNADLGAVRHMLLAVIGNALKFTGERGKISVTARFGKATCILTVADTGTGIAADQILTLSEPFVSRDPGAADTQPRGLGLGLTVTRRLVELHGGVLKIESVPGRGTSVHIIFPPERVGEPVDVAADSSGVVDGQASAPAALAPASVDPAAAPTLAPIATGRPPTREDLRQTRRERRRAAALSRNSTGALVSPEAA